MNTYEIEKAYGYDNIIVVLKYVNYENADGSYVFRNWAIETLGM